MLYPTEAEAAAAEQEFRERQRNDAADLLDFSAPLNEADDEEPIEEEESETPATQGDEVEQERNEEANIEAEEQETPATQGDAVEQERIKEQQEQVEKDKEEPKQTEAELLQKQVEALRKELNEVTARVSAPAEKKTEKEGEASAEKPTVAEESDAPFTVDATRFQKALRDPAEFSAILNEAIAAGRQLALRDAMRIARDTATSTYSMSRAVEKFYTDNPDLEQHRSYVQFVMNETIAKEPELTLEALLEKTAAGVRAKLGVQKQAEKVETARREKAPRNTAARKSGLVGGSRGSAPSTRSFEVDVDAQRKGAAEML